MLSVALFNTVQGKLASTYQGPDKAVPWAQIIAFIMSMLGGVCPTPPTPADAKKQAADNPSYLDYSVRTALIQEYGLGAWQRHDGTGISAAVKSTIADLDDATMTEVIASV